MADIEKQNTRTPDTQFSAEDYQALLLQAVAVIESARSAVARHLMATTSNTYWEIGKSLQKCSRQKCSKLLQNCTNLLQNRKFRKIGVALDANKAKTSSTRRKNYI